MPATPTNVAAGLRELAQQCSVDADGAPTTDRYELGAAHAFERAAGLVEKIPTTGAMSSVEAALALIALAHTGETKLTAVDGDDIGTWLHENRSANYHRLNAAEKLLIRLVQTVWNGSGDVTIPEIADAFGPTTKAAVLDILKARFA